MDVQNIRAIVLDVDGVLTDGRLYYTDAGETVKVFYVQDGSAIKSWQAAGGKLGLISGRRSPIVAARAAELGVAHVVQGVADKLEPFQELLAAWDVTAAQVCYVGDDTADIPPMQACGFAAAVANATGGVKDVAHYVAEACGGQGAVREIIQYLLEHNAPCTRAHN